MSVSLKGIAKTCSTSTAVMMEEEEEAYWRAQTVNLVRDKIIN